MVYGARLESAFGASHREFESHTLRIFLLELACRAPKEIFVVRFEQWRGSGNRVRFPESEIIQNRGF